MTTGSATSLPYGINVFYDTSDACSVPDQKKVLYKKVILFCLLVGKIRGPFLKSYSVQTLMFTKYVQLQSCSFRAI